MHWTGTTEKAAGAAAATQASRTPRTPRTSRIPAVAVAAAGAVLLLGGAAAAGPSIAAVAAPAPAMAAAPAVAIDDADDLIPADEEARLIDATRSMTLPGEVTDVAYLVFGDNDDNINDTVESRLRETSSPLIGDDVYADGALILAYGDDPRANGIYAGEDVADRLQLREGRHLDESVEAMRPAMRDGRIADGFIDGLRYAADDAAIAADQVAEEESGRRSAIIGGSIAGGAALLGGAGATWAVVAARRKKLREARENHAYVVKHYGDAGTRLDEIDIRAHNLTSPLADDELRRQWTEVRDGFLEVHGIMDGIGEPATDAEFRAAAGELATAREAIERIRTAEDNIDVLWNMEHGDEASRRGQLRLLRDDLVRAQADVSDDELRRRLADLEARVRAMGDDAGGAGFMDDYADVLHDYRLVLEVVREREFDGMELGGDRVAPRLWEAGWRAGSGYGGWLPFMTMHAWHQSDAAAAQSSGTSTSYSSGFSGAGGGGRF